MVLLRLRFARVGQGLQCLLLLIKLLGLLRYGGLFRIFVLLQLLDLGVGAALLLAPLLVLDLLSLLRLLELRVRNRILNGGTGRLKKGARLSHGLVFGSRVLLELL